jgi:predicted acylesterase/phospholipase RssA
MHLEPSVSRTIGKRRTSTGHQTWRPGSLSLLAGLAFLVLLLQGCAILTRPYKPPPAALENQVQIPGLPGVRAWGDEFSLSLEESAIESLEQEKTANHGKLEEVVFVLALSGGGAEGAFGAGILCGWSQTGTRPRFKLVTGISTGALMAPYAFLGPTYDDRLKKAYTTISAEDIFRAHGPVAILLSLANLKELTSLADSSPLAELVARLIDPQVLQEIAQEHLKGRRLLVGTTQLDAQRLVIWNMGAIAASGHPQALKLFRKIMVASAAIPGMFPPQYFEVEAGGEKFQEMHVDGGTKAQVMLYEAAINLIVVGGQRPRQLFIIRNEQVYPEWKKVKPQLKYIAARAIDTLLKSQGVGDLFRLYVYAQRDNFDYNLAYIPEAFTTRPTSPFDTAYMNRLFQLGYDLASRGFAWRKYPPGFEPCRGGQ